jgi:hypothetical protein
MRNNTVFGYYDVTEDVRKAGYENPQLRISIWDSHPNELAHKLIANAVHEELGRRGLFPRHNQ